MKTKHAPNLLRCLKRLVIAAANREHTQGCPIRLIEVQAELRSAVAEARIAINKARGNI